MPRSWSAIVSGPVLVFALLTGCPGPGPDPEEPATTDETSADGSTGETGPEVETSSAEATGTAGAEQAVLTPRLPIGGSSPDDEDPEQCAQASFLGEGDTSIPPGVSIVVTDAVFLTGVFEVGGDGCTDVDDPPCLSSFIFTKDDPGQCSVPVRTDVTRPADDEDDDEPQDRLSLAGRLQCPDDQETVCRELARRLERDDQTIELFAPVATTSESTTESTEPTGTTDPTDPTGTTDPTGSTGPTGTTESTGGTTTSSAGGG